MKAFRSACIPAALAAALLAAYVPAAEAAPVLMPPAADPVCASASAQVAGTKVNFAEDLLTAEGTWSAAGGAVGALLEYRVDNDRWFSETRLGASGPWDLRIRFNDCGRHRVRIYIAPTVEAGGRQVHCLDRMQSALLDFENFCGPKIEVAHCDWECQDDPEPQCAGTCSVQASGGNPPYAVFHGPNDRDYEMATAESTGRWSVAVACAPGGKVFFKVRDQGGIGGFSRPVEVTCGSR